jgi:predicted Zn-dependent protease
MALLGSKQLEEAEKTARQATRQPTAELSPYAVLAAILGQSGKDAEAQQAMADLLRIKQDISISHIEQIFPYRDKVNLEYLIEGLRKAGIPH